jgi:SNF2-related domain
MTAFLPGTQVLTRGRPWEVVHVEPAGESQRFRLRCLQGDLRGMEMDFLSPLEAIEPVVAELQPTRAGRLAHWRLYHQAFLLEQSLGPRALLAVEPGRIEMAPYQLVPVMRALAMSRPRLLLADGVGLGKTIQAGLVLAELIARRRAHRILVVSPAGPLLNQWHQEMRGRFGLRFQAIRDWGELQEVRRSLVLGANPFDHLGLCLTSIDFAKQDKVLQDLERATWDMVVIDEAHHCVRMGDAGDREDSRRRRLAELLARQADGLLLLIRSGPAAVG